MLIRDRPHNTSDRQTVKVVVNKDEEAQTASSENRSFAVFDFPAGNLTVLLSAAGHVQNIDKRTQKSTEEKNLEVYFLAHERKSDIKHLD